MRLLFVAICVLFSTQAFGGFKQQNSFDLGIDIVPTATPESGYKGMKTRLGIEFGLALFKYEEVYKMKVKGLTSQPKTTVRFLRFGLGTVENNPIITFSPISFFIKDKAYFSPTFGFGKNPYTAFTLSYELFP